MGGHNLCLILYGDVTGILLNSAGKILAAGKYHTVYEHLNKRDFIQLFCYTSLVAVSYVATQFHVSNSDGRMSKCVKTSL